MVRLASVRRSLFANDAARSKFLAHLMTGTKEILQSGLGIIGLYAISIKFLRVNSTCGPQTMGQILFYPQS